MAESGAPSDLDEVRVAFRLGWAVAELRGRYRPDLFDQPEPREPGEPGPFTRIRDELPLANERKDQEIRIEIFKVVQGLIGLLKLSLKLDGKPKLDLLDEKLKELEAADDNTRSELWNQKNGVAHLLYRWDAQLQDASSLRARPSGAPLRGSLRSALTGRP